MPNKPRLSPNGPRCPVCAAPLNLWATIADDVRAECRTCEWTWRGGDA